MKAPEGDRAKAIYHSVIVVRADNAAINSIRDLKGRTMAFVDPDSTSGNLLPTADIIKAFPELHLNSDHLHANGDFFEAVSYSGKHQAGLQAVLKGDIDAAPCSDNILAFEISRGAVPQGALKVIHTSAPSPPRPSWWAARSPPRRVRRFKPSSRPTTTKPTSRSSSRSPARASSSAPRPTTSPSWTSTFP